MSVKPELRVLLRNTGEEMHHTGYGWEGSNKTPKRKSGDKDSPYRELWSHLDWLRLQQLIRKIGFCGPGHHCD